MANDVKRGHSRRKFMANSALAAFSFHYIHSRLLGADAPSNKLNIAGIGIGGMGGGNLRQCAGENIVALCDVDTEYAAHTFKKYPNAKVYKDYRNMFDKQKDIDAVVIATPDHTHAVITMEAMRRGKHVFCQKPLTHTVFEARKMGENTRYRLRWATRGTPVSISGCSKNGLTTERLGMSRRFMPGRTGR